MDNANSNAPTGENEEEKQSNAPPSESSSAISGSTTDGQEGGEYEIEDVTMDQNEDNGNGSMQSDASNAASHSSLMPPTESNASVPATTSQFNAFKLPALETPEELKLKVFDAVMHCCPDIPQTPMLQRPMPSFNNAHGNFRIKFEVLERDIVVVGQKEDGTFPRIEHLCEYADMEFAPSTGWKDDAEYALFKNWVINKVSSMPRKYPTQRRTCPDIDDMKHLDANTVNRAEPSEVNAAMLVLKEGWGEMPTMLDVAVQMRHEKTRTNAKCTFEVDKEKHAIFGTFIFKRKHPKPMLGGPKMQVIRQKRQIFMYAHGRPSPKDGWEHQQQMLDFEQWLRIAGSNVTVERMLEIRKLEAVVRMKKVTEIKDAKVDHQAMRAKNKADHKAMLDAETTMHQILYPPPLMPRSNMPLDEVYRRTMEEAAKEKERQEESQRIPRWDTELESYAIHSFTTRAVSSNSNIDDISDNSSYGEESWTPSTTIVQNGTQWTDNYMVMKNNGVDMDNAPLPTMPSDDNNSFINAADMGIILHMERQERNAKLDRLEARVISLESKKAENANALLQGEVTGYASGNNRGRQRERDRSNASDHYNARSSRSPVNRTFPSKRGRGTNRNISLPRNRRSQEYAEERNARNFMPKKRRSNSSERNAPPMRHSHSAPSQQHAPPVQQQQRLDQLRRANPDETLIDDDSPWNDPNANRTAMQRGTGQELYRPNYAGADYADLVEALIEEAEFNNYPPQDMPENRRRIHELGLIIGHKGVFDCLFCYGDDHWPADCPIFNLARDRRRLTKARKRCLQCRRMHAPNRPHPSQAETCNEVKGQCQFDDAHHEIFCSFTKKDDRARNNRARAEEFNRQRRPGRYAR